MKRIIILLFLPLTCFADYKFNKDELYKDGYTNTITINSRGSRTYDLSFDREYFDKRKGKYRKFSYAKISNMTCYAKRVSRISSKLKELRCLKDGMKNDGVNIDYVFTLSPYGYDLIVTSTYMNRFTKKLVVKTDLVIKGMNLLN